MLKEIVDHLNSAPTIMSLTQMKEFISDLMGVPNNYLKENIEDFCAALEVLVESYNSGTYFEVTEGDKPFFRDFSKWILGFSEEIGLSDWQKEEFKSIAEAFLIFPDEVYGG